MAEFKADGLDSLMLSMQEIAEIPDDVQDEMLNAQANVVVRAQKRKIRAYRIYDTGQAQRSIKKGKVKVKKGTRVIYITPTGTRKRGEKQTRNAEILFVNEYGRRGKKARPAIRDANVESADETTAAGMEPYDRWLKSKGL